MPGLPVACYPAAVCLLPRCYLLCSRRCSPLLLSAAAACCCSVTAAVGYCYLPYRLLLLLPLPPAFPFAAAAACHSFHCCCCLLRIFIFFATMETFFFATMETFFFLQPWSLLGWTGGDSHSFRVTFIPTPNDSRIHAFTFASSGAHAFRMRRGCTDACAHDVIYPTRTHDSRCDRRSSSIIHHRRCDPTMMLAVDLTLIR
jgi:hypothetical protein